jgi:hypothetical protein
MTPDEIPATVCSLHYGLVSKVNRQTVLHAIVIALQTLILLLVVG